MCTNRLNSKFQFRLMIVRLFLLVILASSCSHTSETQDKYRIEPVTNLTVQAGLSSNITYHKVDGHELKLDVIVPRIDLGQDPWWTFDGEKKPALLYIHGGGWVDGEKETRLLGLLPFVAKNWVVININYRLAKDAKAPAAVADCRQSLYWVFENAEKYQIDITRIVVAGESAGGHLALMTGMLQKGDSLCSGKYVVHQDKKVAAIINWFGVTDLQKKDNMKDYPWFDKNDNNFEETLRSLSPVTYISKNNPPIMSIHGSADPVVLPSQSELLHKKLEEIGVKNKLVIVPGKKHGNFSGLERTQIFEQIWDFLESNGIKTANEPE